jgi:hypothetical protein
MQNENFTANIIHAGNGAALWADCLTRVSAFDFINVLRNVGHCAFSYNANSLNRGYFRLSCVSFYSNGPDDTNYGNKLSAIMYILNGRGAVENCIFSQTYQSGTWRVISVEGDCYVEFTGCVFSSSFPTGAITLVAASNKQYSTTASYDPLVPISVCVIPESTPQPSKTPGFSGSRRFTISAQFGATENLTVSQRIDPSEQWANSPQLANSPEFESSSELTFSEAFSPSGALEATEHLPASHAFGPSEHFTNSAELSESSDFTPSSEFAVSEGLPASDGLEATEPLKGSIGFSESERFEGSKKLDASRVFGETQALPATSNFTKTAEFSPSSEFTFRRARYLPGRMAFDFSGYLFFVFYPDG